MESINLYNLTEWERRVFAAALLERMWPSYAVFSETTKYGDSSLLKNQLDLVWQKLADTHFKFNLDVQLEKLEDNTPNPDNFDLFAVYPALDFCSGMMSLLSSYQDKLVNPAIEVAFLSQNSVESYLTACNLENAKSELNNKSFTADPLYIWEMEMQQAIVDCIKDQDESKTTCKVIRQLATESGLSNLGIDY